ncbi:taste receptor type 2 member 14-like [Marmota flaviventris]|uniref:taste receptor type 2 member 14-like n=1 Tax=Marmota flaviventris TaxID=93162 RepID=UPI000FFF9CE3|nr:taste receptor type 2 member 14-like [Marmota flaviventris]
MVGVEQSMFSIILSVEFIMGNFGNGFIALVNCVDWVKRRKISSVDQILTALALSRIGMVWIFFLDWWVPVLYSNLWATVMIIRIIYSTYTVINHFSIWFATSLSIFYFLKIATFSNSVFLYLRWRIKIVISVTLMVSLVVLLLNIMVINLYIDICVDEYRGNLTDSSGLSRDVHFFILLSFTITVFTFIPFTVSLITFLLLIFSLWKHLKRMQHSAKGSKDTSTTAHVKALQTVIAFLLLYAIFFLSFLVQFLTSGFLNSNLIVFLTKAGGAAFPTGHSFVLILRNGKLRQASQSVLWWLRCKSQDSEPSGP